MQNSPVSHILMPQPARSRLREWARRTSIEDLLTCANHSRDFRGSRAEYINFRLWLLGLAFGVFALLWIPFDLAFLEDGERLPMLALRLGFSGGFLGLALLPVRPQDLAAARWRLLGLVTIPILFYFGSRWVLGGGIPAEGVLAGYSFLPFLMVALLGIFPLTLVEGGILTTLTALGKMAADLWFGTLFTLSTLGDIWLLGLLAVTALWAEQSQLHMLLRLYREATRDSLTGLMNRRPMTKWLEMEIRRLEEERRPLAVLLMDLDYFKRINDTYGHLTGDAVLQRFALILTAALPNPELIGRWGGEEFLVALPGMDVEQAAKVAELIRATCPEEPVQGPEGETVTFTTSIGVTQLRPEESLDDLMARVDEGLYRAKEHGRDMVVTV